MKKNWIEKIEICICGKERRELCAIRRERKSIISNLYLYLPLLRNHRWNHRLKEATLFETRARWQFCFAKFHRAYRILSARKCASFAKRQNINKPVPFCTSDTAIDMYLGKDRTIENVIDKRERERERVADLGWYRFIEQLFLKGKPSTRNRNRRRDARYRLTESRVSSSLPIGQPPKALSSPVKNPQRCSGCSSFPCSPWSPERKKRKKATLCVRLIPLTLTPSSESKSPKGQGKFLFVVVAVLSITNGSLLRWRVASFVFVRIDSEEKRERKRKKKGKERYPRVGWDCKNRESISWLIEPIPNLNLT